MGRFRQHITNRRGDSFLFMIILVFLILTLAVILTEYFRMESLYQQVEYVLQRGVNSSVDYAMLDEYRKDGCGRMDGNLAVDMLYQYFQEEMGLDAGLNKYIDGQWVYTLEIQSIDASDEPPKLTLTGDLKTRSIFSFLNGEIRLPFTVASANNRIEEGGSP